MQVLTRSTLSQNNTIMDKLTTILVSMPQTVQLKTRCHWFRYHDICISV